jgi:monoamine oxidase
MERFIDGLAAPFKDSIRTNMCVSAINYDDKDKVVIECASGETIVTEYVVVTCSLGYLKSDQLKFEPELPKDKAGAIGRSKMGQYMKVLLQFPSVFWPEDSIFLGQLTDNTKNSSAVEDSDDKRVHFPAFFNYYYAKGAPVLEAQLVGAKAQLLSDTMTDAEIARAMYLQLQETFGPDIPAPVNHFITHWDHNKWSVGAYSCMTVGNTDDDPDLLRHPVGKRVFFAGEATDYKYQGALQAAYFTGRQAADEIVGDAEPIVSIP